MSEIPRLDKRILKVTTLSDRDDEKKYWLSRTPEERLNAVEINRRMVYGKDRTAARLQRFLEVVELSRR
ncbi:MAG: hypothetical protein EHM45_19990 [Desulfobacteraceae bacterium]|nr:MAG: hypothetical protein EHM45_19990 [Desulfobacteraceae bacterium]